MRVEVLFPSDIEAEVESNERRGLSRPESLAIKPYFFNPDGRVPIVYLIAYDDDNKVIAKYVVMQSGHTGRLSLANRTTPSTPRYELERVGAGNLQDDEEDDDELEE